MFQVILKTYILRISRKLAHNRWMYEFPFGINPLSSTIVTSTYCSILARCIRDTERVTRIVGVFEKAYILARNSGPPVKNM